MPGVTDELLKAITAEIAKASRLNLDSASDASDVFEAYVFSLVIRAARAEGARISYRDPTDSPCGDIVFRTSPGYLYSDTKPYTFAVIDFPDADPLEAHLGVRISGRSEVLHEFDVSVISRTEGSTCRNGRTHPRQAKMVLGIECKFYTTAIGLGLARAFMGLTADVTIADKFFVANTDSPRVEKLLTKSKRDWASNLTPRLPDQVGMFTSQIRQVFVRYKSGSR